MSSASGECRKANVQPFKVSRTYSVRTLFWPISTFHSQSGFPVTLQSVASELCFSTDSSERPKCISDVSKILTDTQRRYSQIALATAFALKKFHQFLYGENFILVTNHKVLLALFGLNNATPVPAANRLARWVLLLNLFY